MAGAVKLVSPAELPPAGIELFRVSRAGPATMVLVVGGWVAACAWVWWMGGLGKVRIPSALAGLVVFWMGLYWLYVVNELRKAMRPEAWLAALGPDGVYVNLRSYRNLSWDVPRRCVAFVPYALITRARAEPVDTSPSAEDPGDATRAIELVLHDADYDELESIIEDERTGPAEATPLARMLWKSSPVRFEAKTLSIGWRANLGANAFLDAISRRGVHVARAWREVVMRAS